MGESSEGKLVPFHSFLNLAVENPLIHYPGQHDESDAVSLSLTELHVVSACRLDYLLLVALVSVEKHFLFGWLKGGVQMQVQMRMRLVF